MTDKCVECQAIEIMRKFAHFFALKLAFAAEMFLFYKSQNIEKYYDGEKKKGICMTWVMIFIRNSQPFRELHIQNGF